MPTLRLVNPSAADAAPAAPAEAAAPGIVGAIAASGAPPHLAHSRPPRLRFGPFVLDGHTQQLLRDGQAQALAPRPHALLVYLLGTGGRLVSKDELLDAVWGHRHVSDSVLKVAINTLRGALGDDSAAPRFIETVSRRGYRFVAPVQPLGEGAAAVAPAAPDAHIAQLASAASATPTPPRGNLPAVRPGLVGREAEQAALRQLMAEHRLVSLVGPGGVGKTRLALTCAGIDAPADGVWLVRLDALAEPGPLVETVGRTLALAGGAGRDGETLARALAPLSVRIVIDNAEHLVQAVATELARWLAQAPQVQLLVTSQLPLRLAGEQLLSLRPLPVPESAAPSADVDNKDAQLKLQGLPRLSSDGCAMGLTDPTHCSPYFY